MHFRTARILLLCASLLLRVMVDARPLTEKGADSAATHEKGKRHLEYFDFFRQQRPEDSNHIEFPPDVPTESSHTATACTRTVNETRNMTVHDFDAETGMVSTRIEEVTRPVTKCCEGYNKTSGCKTRIEPEPEEGSGGDNQYPFDLDNPCAGLVCDEASHAPVQCMLVSKCGFDLPLFFDVERGRLAHCNNYPTGQPVDLGALMCTGFCAEPNPCRGLTCPSHPDAVCFVTGCNCNATWLLPTGVEVDCSTGKNVPPKRRRRQTESC